MAGTPANNRHARVVVITGCSSGLGNALARAFRKQQTWQGRASVFRVFATARRLQSIEDLQLEGMDTVQLDVTDNDSIDRAIQHVEREAGQIDVLICNAGSAILAPLIEQKLSEIEAVLATNTMEPLLCARAAAPIMIRQRSGVIALIGSIASDLSIPFNGPYSASKAGAARFFDTLRLELAPFSVAVTVVEAGWFKSKMRANVPDPSHYVKEGSLYSKGAKALLDLQRVDAKLQNAATSDEVAQVIVKKVSRKHGPAPRFIVGTQILQLKLFAFLYSYVMPGFIHKAILRMFGLKQKW